ncbi:Homocysteine S-methyltransferase [Sulfitobacter noctilucicola]|uniref:Homocysteine S-methyltransferase n=1 Tax=Sulfitobacter noctilucicola TaxID=1342301 RepID=A0A7W6M4L3_9RHOB|nr:homocysteine S-methyltransferase family protein [Sulfitobacter noctilucicola]KIN63154.1 Homocysteine S-methyltransferase [Sulfitobacter noctilucicola]MBB4172320.1 homocysteine S-methyltransferase [Sulfitobacter noctilucicola]
MTDITLLDGGMGQELVHRAGNRPTPLWSTQVMLEHPGLVADVHRDFTKAGATIATTNTYAILRDRLEGTGLSERFADLLTMALAEARTSGAKRIAGSIGPIRASYRPDLHPDANTGAPIYAEIAQMIGPSCDLILCETVASVTHAEAILRGGAAAGKPVWLALTVQDDDGTRLRSGESLADAMPFAKAGAAAVLVNCAAPEAIPAALDVLATSGLPYGAYANAFEKITDDFLKDRPTVDALQKRVDMTPEAYADHVMAWVDQGATIVGGCCEVSPDHIAEIARRLNAAGHSIV